MIDSNNALPFQNNNLSLTSSNDKVFDYLVVKNKIIDMGHRSITIPNISSITLLQKSFSKIPFIVGALFFGALALASQVEGKILFFIIAIGAIIAMFLMPQKWYLAISTNDGALSLFHSNSINFLKDVKRAIDEKLNGEKPDATFKANFNTFNIEKIDKVTHLGDRY